jgi:hypothetical protein
MTMDAHGMRTLPPTSRTSHHQYCHGAATMLYNQLRLILIESLNAYFQLLEVCTQDAEVPLRGLAIHHLVSEWAAKVGHGKMVLK